MATIREGTKGALVVVDVQVGVMENAWNAESVIANIAHVVDRAREAGVPVIWVQHADDDLPRGSAEWHWAPALTPATNETLIHKQFNSSFEGTSLESTLADMQVSHLVLAGAATNWCIRATAYAALERGYDVTLVKDAHTTRDTDLGDGEIIEAKSFVCDLNIALRWLSYPNRVNSVAAAEEVNLAALA
jgi:nicotinamidase-related amidase